MDGNLKSVINTENDIEMKVYSQIITNDSVIFDIGARDSNLPLINGNANYFLFEPIKYNYDNLINRFADFTNVKIINEGLSDEYEIKKIYVESESINRRINFNYVWNHIKPERVINGDQETIVCNTLNNFILENNIGKIDLLKIDVEGYEYKVIKGLGDKINIVNNIVFEYSIGTYESSNVTLIELLELLNGFEFKLLINDKIENLPKNINIIYDLVKNIDNCNIHAKKIN